MVQHLACPLLRLLNSAAPDRFGWASAASLRRCPSILLIRHCMSTLLMGAATSCFSVLLQCVLANLATPEAIALRRFLLRCGRWSASCGRKRRTCESARKRKGASATNLAVRNPCLETSQTQRCQLAPVRGGHASMPRGKYDGVCAVLARSVALGAGLLPHVRTRSFRYLTQLEPPEAGRMWLVPVRLLVQRRSESGPRTPMTEHVHRISL